MIVILGRHEGHQQILLLISDCVSKAPFSPSPSDDAHHWVEDTCQHARSKSCGCQNTLQLVQPHSRHMGCYHETKHL